MAAAVNDMASRGLALRCDSGGRLGSVLRDDFGISAGLSAGMPVRRMVDSEARGKFDAFIERLTTSPIVVDWQITVACDGGLKPLHFTGLDLGTDRLILATDRRSDLVLLAAAQLQTIVPATTGQRIVQHLTAALAQRAGDDAALYEELMHANNELVTLQRQLAKSHHELERLNAEKNRWLGIAAHDLRSPLAIVQTYSDFIAAEAGAALGTEQHQFLDAMRDAIASMRRLIDDLLDVACIEAGRLVLRREPADLAALMAGNAARNRLLAMRKNIALVCEIRSAGQPWIDAARIEQVLDNLIGNAIKFSSPGTTIRVSLDREDEALAIAIADQGTGIAAAQLEQLFRPFVSGSTIGTAGERGAGLGLAIARRVIEEHGGRLTVQTEPGCGTVFHFSLPLTVPPSQQP